MLRLSKIGLIFTMIVFSDYYILDPSYRLYNIFLALSFFTFCMEIFFIKKKGLVISKDTRDILLVSFIFLSYLYISDIVKNDPIEGAKMFYPILLIPLMLLVFEYGSRFFDSCKFFSIAVSIGILFAVLQIFGFSYNLSALFSNLGIIHADERLYTLVIEGQGRRVIGATFNLISFAEYLSILIMIMYFRFLEKRKLVLLIAIAVMIVVLFFTQTRSALYGLGPTIIFVHLLCGQKNIRGFLKISAAILIMLFAVFLFSGIIEKYFYRLTTPFEATALERFQTNYYAMLGVWRQAPIFGIPKDMAWEVISGTALQEGLVFGDQLRITTTHHNQVLYYFRYYGLVGVALLIFLYVMVFKKIAHTPNKITKMILFSIFIFDLQYSMGHNNKLVNNVILWILLSIASASGFGNMSVTSSGAKRDAVQIYEPK